METLTALEVLLSNSLIAMVGVTLGKWWGASGKQSLITCREFQGRCQELWKSNNIATEKRMDRCFSDLNKRLDHIEEKVDRLNGNCVLK